MKNKKGFTLIELLVVIAIIGVLSSLVLVSVLGPRKQANATKAKADLNNIMVAAEICAASGDTSAVPTSGSITCAGDVALQAIPTAPSGWPAYSITGTYDAYTLTASGFENSETFTCTNGSCVCSTVNACTK